MVWNRLIRRKRSLDPALPEDAAVVCGPSSQRTLSWREMDSNHRYPAEFFWLPPSIPPIHLRNINRLPRDRDRWFESISLQRGDGMGRRRGDGTIVAVAN
jgi:hypothetical protein